MKELVDKYTVENPSSGVYLGIPTALLTSTNDLRADYHPSYRGQAKIASILVSVFVILGSFIKIKFK